MLTLFTFLFCSIDKGLEYIFNIKDTSKYFFTHFIGNSIVCYLTFRDTFNMLLFPKETILSTVSDPLVYNCVEAIHLYHILLYFNRLTAIDWIHHVMTYITLYAARYDENGVLTHMGIFFLCGLPGGIDYLLLFLVKRNIIHKNTEKNA